MYIKTLKNKKTKKPEVVYYDNDPREAFQGLKDSANNLAQIMEAIDVVSKIVPHIDGLGFDLNYNFLFGHYYSPQQLKQIKKNCDALFTFIKKVKQTDEWHYIYKMDNGYVFQLTGMDKGE